MLEGKHAKRNAFETEVGFSGFQDNGKCRFRQNEFGIDAQTPAERKRYGS